MFPHDFLDLILVRCRRARRQSMRRTCSTPILCAFCQRSCLRGRRKAYSPIRRLSPALQIRRRNGSARSVSIACSMARSTATVVRSAAGRRYFPVDAEQWNALRWLLQGESVELRLRTEVIRSTTIWRKHSMLRQTTSCQLRSSQRLRWSRIGIETKNEEVTRHASRIRLTLALSPLSRAHAFFSTT